MPSNTQTTVVTAVPIRGALEVDEPGLPLNGDTHPLAGVLDLGLGRREAGVSAVSSPVAARSAAASTLVMAE